MQFINKLFTAYSQAITSFFYIAIVLIVYMQIQRNAQLEESWLGILRTPVNTRLYYVLLYGLLGGLVVSFLLMILDITIDYDIMLLIWPLSLFLALIDIRYLCPAYSMGIVSLISLLFGWPKAEVSSLMVIVGLLHILESILIYIDGARDSIPVYIEHERFTPAGAYVMEKIWPVPLAVLMFPGRIMFPIVVALSYEDEAIVQSPGERAKESSYLIGIYGIVITILAIISHRLTWVRYLVVIAVPILHELIAVANKMGQHHGEPAFIAPWRGIRVLDVLPEGPGHIMGLKQGDIILGINGRQVNSEAMLEEILGDFPTLLWVNVLRDGKGFIELEYRDLHGGTDDLRIMLIPRTTGKYYRFREPKGILVRIWQGLFNK